MNGITLSICIATRNRAGLIGETLSSIISQATDEVEVVIVDGASTDNTGEVVQRFQQQFSRLRYFRQGINGGVDRDYSLTVEFADGKYCWFMSDDDVFKPGAIQTVLRHLQDGYDLVVVNAENRTYNLSRVLEERQLNLKADRVYSPTDNETLFVDIGKHLSYIPSVVIRREVWNARNRDSYYGTGFVHVGVIFQIPLENAALVIAEPLIIARQGNTSWNARVFEIWMFTWPNLIWSFPHYPDSAKRKVFPKDPWRNLLHLLVYRGKGYYSKVQYQRWLEASDSSNGYKFMARIIASLPLCLVSSLLLAYLAIFEPGKRTTFYALYSSSFLWKCFQRIRLIPRSM